MTSSNFVACSWRMGDVPRVKVRIEANYDDAQVDWLADRCNRRLRRSAVPVLRRDL